MSKRVKNLSRTMQVINLSRPKMEEGEPILQKEKDPKQAPVDIRPTDQGDIIDYRTRQGQRKIEGRDETLYLQPRGCKGHTVELTEDEMRSPDLQAKIREGLIRVLD